MMLNLALIGVRYPHINMLVIAVSSRCYLGNCSGSNSMWLGVVQKEVIKTKVFIKDYTRRTIIL